MAETLMNGLRDGLVNVESLDRSDLQNLTGTELRMLATIQQVGQLERLQRPFNLLEIYLTTEAPDTLLNSLKNDPDLASNLQAGGRHLPKLEQIHDAIHHETAYQPFNRHTSFPDRARSGGMRAYLQRQLS